ncbi:MAG: ABC transporter ATP-binding protein, partial [Candidatus Latescibacteria bacterium]|nr:ABC transporter ATP-binding protein [Candidatus Latescibacterota bacterium]
MDNVRLVISYFRGRWKPIAFGSVFVVATNLLQVVQPALVGKVIDLLRADYDMRGLLGICALILAIELGKGGTRFLMRYIIIGNSWRIENDIRLRVYNHLLSLPLSYYNRTRTGDIIARITNDLTAVRAMIGPAVMYAINALILGPAVLVLMFRIDAELALYGVIPFPFIAIMIFWASKRIHRYFRTVQESYSDISAHVQEDLNGVRLIKAYVLEKRELDSLRGLSGTYVDNNKKVINLQSVFHPLLDVMSSAGVIIVLWVGGGKVIDGATTLGALVSLIMYIGMLVWPSIALGWVVAIFQRGTASLGRIQEILDETPERGDDESDITPIEGGI